MLLRFIALAALLCSTLLPTAHAMSPNYLLIKEEQGVKVYRSETHEQGKLFAFKGVTSYDAPVAKVLYVLMDNEHRVEWVDRLYYSEELERNSPHDYVLYQAFELPAIMSNRDYVYHGKATITPDTGVVTLALQSVEHAKAPETIGVRANLINSRYVLTPMADGKTQIEVEIITDPKGWLPAWLTNSIQEDWPVSTLTAIRGQLSKPYTELWPLPPGGPDTSAASEEAAAPEAEAGAEAEASPDGEAAEEAAETPEAAPAEEAEAAPAEEAEAPEAP